jgi:hypothetical protein
MKRAYLVLGAESSGTRMLTGLLIDGGCKGSDEDKQPFDDWKFGDQDPIVWRRSYPWTEHHLWPNVELDLLKPLRKHGYDVARALVITRDWFTLARSQASAERHHVATQQDAIENMQFAYREIFTQLAALCLPYLIVTYESLTVYGERTARPLLAELGLEDQATLKQLRKETCDNRYVPTDSPSYRWEGSSSVPAPPPGTIAGIVKVL